MARLLHEVGQIPWHTDQELVCAVRRGDDSAFGELFCRYRGRIGAYVTRILGDADRAEDVTQEVFISALRRLRDTECPVTFKPWAYQIAKNASIDELRRVRRASEVPLDQERESGEDKLELFSSDPSPESAMESKQQLDDLRVAFRALSELHQRILVLRELEGLSYAAIGQRLGMSRPVVESTLFRARRRLTNEYKELISGERCESTRAVIDAWENDKPGRMGIRERRRLVRHLAHCQVCRRHASLARAGAPSPRAVIAAANNGASAGAHTAPTPIPLAGWRRTAVGAGVAATARPDSRAVA
jgi:RNA polymerase sigma factor (sigma-70 family)